MSLVGIQVKVHPVQAKILCSLLLRREARFSELNKTRLTNDHFSFHLNKLLSLLLVEKLPSGSYQLTPKGKEFANRFDTQRKQIERQAKLGALVVCVKKEGGQNYYLVQQRLKQPYYGFHGFITGKVTWGETIYETGARELKEETGLQGKLTLVGIKHKMDYSNDTQPLEDKYFFVFRAHQLTGALLKKFQGGTNQWLTAEDILRLPNLFDGVEESLEMVKQNNLIFSENKYTVSSY